MKRIDQLISAASQYPMVDKRRRAALVRMLMQAMRRRPTVEIRIAFFYLAGGISPHGLWE